MTRFIFRFWSKIDEQSGCNRTALVSIVKKKKKKMVVVEHLCQTPEYAESIIRFESTSFEINDRGFLKRINEFVSTIFF